jgi:hypothetical protein
MLALAVELFRLDALWMRGAFYLDDMPVTTARGLIGIANGPGFVLTFWLRLPPVRVCGSEMWDTGRLAGIVVFWAGIGWLLDRRLAGMRAPLIHQRWLRGSLHALGFGAAVIFLGSALWEIHQELGVWEHMGEFLTSPRWRLMGREALHTGGVLWGSIYATYFGSKLLDFRSHRSGAP